MLYTGGIEPWAQEGMSREGLILCTGGGEEEEVESCAQEGLSAVHRRKSTPCTGGG